MELLYCITLSVVAIVCAIAVLHRNYDDNLLQRLGMALTSFGAVGDVFAASNNAHSHNALTLLAVGLALFALGSVWRHRPGQRERRRADPRVVDFCNSYVESSIHD